MDITLADLLIIEPHLSIAAESPRRESIGRALDQSDVSWAVSIRATPPYLPALRGQEVLIVPDRIAAALGPDVSALIREAALRNASAVVVPASLNRVEVDEAAHGMVFLTWQGDLAPDAEAGINRRLTECRGELYRAGSELERQIAELSANRAGVQPLVRAVAETLDIPISVADARGRDIAGHKTDGFTVDNAEADSAPCVERVLPSRAKVRLGPLTPRQQIVARFFGPRIGDAIEAALKWDDDARPRGTHRTEAIAALLADASAIASEQRSAALAVGFDPDAMFLVAMSGGVSEAIVTRTIAQLGAVHPAGEENGLLASVIAVSSSGSGLSVASRVRALKVSWQCDHRRDGATLAFSAPAYGVAGLPRAAREARFVALLQMHSALSATAATFGSVEDVGALSLLYQLRESNALQQFVLEALGPLEQRDSRGTLRATLRAFLESGGSQVDAAQRLGIHRNTLAYRLRRIGELVGRDVADPSTWLTLHLAIRACDVLEAN